MLACKGISLTGDELRSNSTISDKVKERLLQNYPCFHANLGGMYRQSGKYELAKLHMEQGIQLLEQFGLVPYHDSIPQITNYAVLLTERVFEAEQEMIEAKKQELLGTYTKAGLYLGQKIFK